MARMTVPPGCTGFEMQDGRRYDADRRGRVNVEDRHINAVRAQYGPLGLIETGEPLNVGTKTTRWCRQCQPTRAWNGWNKVCPRCGADTIIEE